MEDFIYESCGQRIKMCMAILCNEKKRNRCHWHKQWEQDRSMVGCFFGKSNCEYFKEEEQR